MEVGAKWWDMLERVKGETGEAVRAGQIDRCGALRAHFSRAGGGHIESDFLQWTMGGPTLEYIKNRTTPDLPGRCL